MLTLGSTLFLWSEIVIFLSRTSAFLVNNLDCASRRVYVREYVWWTCGMFLRELSQKWKTFEIHARDRWVTSKGGHHGRFTRTRIMCNKANPSVSLMVKILYNHFAKFVLYSRNTVEIHLIYLDCKSRVQPKIISLNWRKQGTDKSRISYTLQAEWYQHTRGNK